MPRTLVGLLAAVGVTMSVLVAFAHGALVWLIIVEAAAATGLVAYVSAPVPVISSKKILLDSL
jgi:hypothetical protein